MSILITGVAGFIGCNLARVLINSGESVIGLDNLYRGSLSNIEDLISNNRFLFANVDLSNLNSYREFVKIKYATEAITEVWHMAANSDIPAGIFDAGVDLRDTFMTTYNTLEIMKEFGIGTILFASSSAIYGDLGSTRISEDLGPLFPISNYGAMKLASEAIISAAVEKGINRALIFRFPNVIGIPATHGVILDFIRKLKTSPDRLVVLGDGTQQKSYLHLDELLDAMLFVRDHASERLNYFNIGSGDDGITVRDIAEQVVETVAPNAAIVYGQGNRGWVGDVPKFIYSIEKLLRLGWKPRMDSAAAVRYSIQQIAVKENCQ